jgi:hypothetical protein
MPRCLSFLLALLLSVSTPALAGRLAPGESGSDYEDYMIYPMPPDSAWRGPLLAERSEPYVFEAAPEGVRHFKGATLTSQVYRDATTGGLAFLYQLREAPPSSGTVFDFETLDIHGYAGSSTDIYTTSSYFFVKRSADGDAFSFTFDQSSFDEDFLVRTDGTSYALNPNGFAVGMDFEPGNGSDSHAFAAFAPVPEPSSLATIAAPAALVLLRRRRGRTPS